MELTLLSPTVHETHAISWIELETAVGNMVIQPHHAPLIVTLTPQRIALCMLRSGKQKAIPISGGIAHITRTAVTLILDSVTP